MKIEDIPAECDVKFDVHGHAYASATITVTLTQDDINECRDPDTGELADDVLREKIVNAAFEKGWPGLCAQCTGWGDPERSLEIDGEWEVDEDEDDESPNVHLTK